jgi:hypothetical protein
MIDDRRSAVPSPGWYLDPDTGERRWWNGIAWGNRAREPYATQAAAVGPVRQPVLSMSASVNPWPVWGIAVLPLVTVASLVLVDLKGSARALLVATEAHLVTPPPLSVGFVVAQLLSVAASVAVMVLAFLDRRLLMRRGVVRPFHWAWSLVPLAYLIGRAVVLKRRVGRGTSPLWLHLLLSVGVGAVEGVVVTSAVASVFADRLPG